MNVHSKTVRHAGKRHHGPLPGSRKIYISPACAPDMRVPVREILLDPPRPRAESARLRPLRPLYRGRSARSISPPACRPSAKAGSPARKGLETYQGRAVKAEDNGNVSAEALVAPCPAQRILRRGRDGASGHAISNSPAPGSSPKK